MRERDELAVRLQWSRWEKTWIDYSCRSGNLLISWSFGKYLLEVIKIWWIIASIKNVLLFWQHPPRPGSMRIHLETFLMFRTPNAHNSLRVTPVKAFLKTYIVGSLLRVSFSLTKDLWRDSLCQELYQAMWIKMTKEWSCSGRAVRPCFVSEFCQECN